MMNFRSATAESLSVIEFSPEDKSRESDSCGFCFADLQLESDVNRQMGEPRPE